MANFPFCIVDLYDRVLQEQVSRFSVNQQDVIQAIKSMKYAYLPVKDWKKRKIVEMSTFFDEASYRCAYLHRHAMCCTGVVHFFINLAIKHSDIRYVLENKVNINICSLGGGPGSDALAIAAAFDEFFHFNHCNIRIIDYFKEWENVFMSVFEELQSGRYGIFKEACLSKYLNYEYIQADLLKSFTPEVKQAIRNSDFVSMMYFISATACYKTGTMVQEVFNNMRPGAYALFIDNAGGGFLKMTQRAAKKAGMMTVLGPIEHFNYSNSTFLVKRYGCRSQSQARVSVQIWLKPLEQLKAECGTIVEPEFNFHSHQESLRRNAKPRVPHLMINPLTEISVDSVPKHASEQCQHIVVAEMAIETELPFHFPQNYLERDIENQPFLIAPLRIESSDDSLPRNSSEHYQPIVEPETIIVDKQECCCTIL